MEGYEPLQDKPKVDMTKAEELINAFDRLLPPVCIYIYIFFIHKC